MVCRDYRRVRVTSNCLNSCSYVSIAVVWIKYRRIMPKIFHLFDYFLKNVGCLDITTPDIMSIVIIVLFITIFVIIGLPWKTQFLIAPSWELTGDEFEENRLLLLCFVERTNVEW